MSKHYDMYPSGPYSSEMSDSQNELVPFVMELQGISKEVGTSIDCVRQIIEAMADAYEKATDEDLLLEDNPRCTYDQDTQVLKITLMVTKLDRIVLGQLQVDTLEQVE